MEIKKYHNWNLTADEAKQVQKELSNKVVKEDKFDKPIKYVAGVDVGFSKDGKKSVASAAVLSFPELILVESVIVEDEINFPYIPGLFSFREIPPILKALKQIKTEPHIILCDGQGLAHPRRFGLACHLGVLLDKATIGAAKTRYIGEHQKLANARGSWEYLTENNEEIGAVLRTQDGINPVYVSIGHNITLRSAIKIVLDCSTKYRLPETTRTADHLTLIQ